LISVLSFGCSQLGLFKSMVKYNLQLESVERPADAKERYGETNIAKFQEEGKNRYSFEDELISIVWEIGYKRASFALKNKTDHSIHIIWDESSFVDLSGSSHRLIHSGVKLIDKNQAQPPSIVARKSILEDTVFSASHIRYGGADTGWIYRNWLEPAVNNPAQAKSFEGKTLQFLIPLKVEDVVNEYLFVFRINEANM